MGFYATTTVCERREKMHLSRRSFLTEPDPPSKNRVWDFFEQTTSCTGENWQITQCSRLENPPPPTTTASGVLYYGYRYYNPELGRWVSRDPIGERGGVNLYSFVRNRALWKWDVLGLYNHDYSGLGWNAELRHTIEEAFADVRGALPSILEAIDNAIEKLENPELCGCSRGVVGAVRRKLGQLRDNLRSVLNGLYGTDELELYLFDSDDAGAGIARQGQHWYDPSSRYIEFNVSEDQSFFETDGRPGYVLHELFHYHFGTSTDGSDLDNSADIAISTYTVQLLLNQNPPLERKILLLTHLHLAFLQIEDAELYDACKKLMIRLFFTAED